MGLLAVLKFLLPFLKEMFLGKNSFRYALRKNRVRVFVIILILCSFVTNWFVVPKVFTTSTEYVRLEKDYKKLTSELKQYQADKDFVEKNKAELINNRVAIEQKQERIYELQDKLANCENAPKTITHPKEHQEATDSPKVEATENNKSSHSSNNTRPIKKQPDSKHNISDIRDRLNLEN